MPKTKKKSRPLIKLYHMKKTLYTLTVIMLIASMAYFTGCSKDDSSPDQVLVLVKRSNGKLFSVNKSTGALTEIGLLTYEGDSLSGLRGLIYDPATGKAYAGATNDGGGYFYSIDLKSGVATLLNDNAESNWDGIASTLVCGDSIITNMYSRIVSGSALTRFSKTSGNYGIHRLLNDGNGGEIWSPGGMCYGSNSSQLVIGGNNEIYLSNLSGVVSDTIPLVKTTNIDDTDVYVMTIAKESSTYYAIIFEYNQGNQYLVKINTATGVITEMGLLVNGSNSNFYHCLALVPADKLP